MGVGRFLNPAAFWSAFAPSNLILTTLSTSSIQLNWTVNSTRPDGAKIERSTDGISFTEIGSVSGNIFIDTGLTDWIPYYYRVRNFKGTGYSSYSDIQNTKTWWLDFIITIDTTLPGSASNTVVFPLRAKTANDVVIKWGDGSEDSYSTVGDKTHVYASPGIYQVRISKEMTAFSFNNTGDTLKAIFHDNWGSSEFTSMNSAFRGCTNIQYRASDFPNTSQVTNMTYMFYNTSFNQPVDSFDTSKVTSMSGMFEKSPFNQSVANFDTSKVITMSGMFYGTPFNQSVTNFDTSQVTNMYGMFRDTPFKHSINFNIPLVIYLELMFLLCDINETGTTTNYDATLNNFANRPNTPNNLTFSGGNSKYSAAGKVGRDILISKGWTITDGGLV